MDNTKEYHSFSDEKLGKGVRLVTAKWHVLRLWPLGVRVRLHIDPHDAASLDDKFILKGCTASAVEQDRQVKTVQDDQLPGDQFVDLLFTGLKRDLNYSLEVDPGKEGEPYLLFENIQGDVLGVPMVPSTTGE